MAALAPWWPPALIWRFLQVGGAAVLAVGVWTLVEKSGYLSVLASSTFAASAYILIFSGALVMLTGFLGFSAIIREDRSCLSTVSAACPLLPCAAAGRREPAQGLRKPGQSPSMPSRHPELGSCAENPTTHSGLSLNLRP